MGDPKGFMTYKRRTHSYRPVDERLKEWKEFVVELPGDALREQGARCMDCGVPFCHTGCPLGNLIPDWNDLIYRDQLESAIESLHATNNFPEFTGRVCPAPCEAACVLGINKPPVSIKSIEQYIVDQAFENDLIKPQPAEKQTGKTVAVVGSGPAGLAAAQQLCRAGHTVTVYERDDRIGGLLVYGIPDFKMEKHIVERRADQMRAEGVTFITNADVGRSVPIEDLKKFDAIVLSGGATQARDLPIPGRELKGIHFAMDFLTQQNRRVAGDEVPDEEAILATGKRVVILGGGDTGSDCLGTSHRQEAQHVSQYELLMRPPDAGELNPSWPYWPNIMRTSSSQEEGGDRDWGINTKEFIGDENGHVKQMRAVRVTFETPEGGGRPEMKEVPDSEFVEDVDLVLLAMGFVHPEHYLPNQLDLEQDERGNVKCSEEYQSSVENIFAAGDMRRGQSLVVWAIVEGRECAHHVDKYLMGYSDLPNRNTQFNTSGLLELKR